MSKRGDLYNQMHDAERVVRDIRKQLEAVLLDEARFKPGVVITNGHKKFQITHVYANPSILEIVYSGYYYRQDGRLGVQTKWINEADFADYAVFDSSQQKVD